MQHNSERFSQKDLAGRGKMSKFAVRARVKARKKAVGGSTPQPLENKGERLRVPESGLFARQKYFRKDLAGSKKVRTFALAKRDEGPVRHEREAIFESNSITLFVEKYKEDIKP